MDERIEKLLKAAPPLREEDLTKINALYPAYLFRRRRTREIWTSCCGRKERLSEYSGLMYEEHQPEITKKMRYYGGCGGFYPSSAPRVQEKVQCPYCGKEAVLKEVSRCGNGDNLFSFRRVIVLRWYRKALWAMGYNTEKGYDPKMERLTGKPAAKLTHIWRFTPGRVQYAERDWYNEHGNWYGYREIDTTHLKSGWKCPDGFPYCAKWGKSYDMICTEELDKSPWRYCNQNHYLEGCGFAMRFLALCTGYPMQVEMLLKDGLTEIVDDMVVKGKLNAKVLNWNQPNVLQSFGVPKDVLQDWLISGGNLKLLTAWKALNKEKIHAELQDLNVLYVMRPQQFEKTAENMKRHGISGKKMLNYLQKEYEASEKRYNVQELWNDYIYAAERIGYDMKNPVFLIPRDLSTAHDKATETIQKLESENNAMCQKISDLESRPVEVAVQRDEKAIKDAALEAKKKADAEWSKKVEKAKADLNQKTAQNEKLEKDIADLLEKLKKAEAAGASAEEAEALKEKVSALEKKLKTSDADMTRAKLLFSQLQEVYRKLGDAIDAISDAEAAEKVRAAVKTLLQNWLA